MSPEREAEIAANVEALASFSRQGDRPRATRQRPVEKLGPPVRVKGRRALPRVGVLPVVEWAATPVATAALVVLARAAGLA